MSDFAQKIRNLADECEDTILNSSHEDDGAITARYILAGIRAFCEQEPSEAMIRAAMDCQDADPGDSEETYFYHSFKAALAQALAELEARNAR